MSIDVLIAGGDSVPVQDPALALKSSSHSDLLRRVAQWPPDVLVLEHPGDDAELDRLLAGVREAAPGTRTLVVLQASSALLQLHLLQEGVCGVLLVSEVESALAKAVREVHGGQLWFTRTVLRQAIAVMAGHGPRPITLVPGEQDLTPREAEIVHLIGAGLSNKEIARRLQISDQTVKTHLHHVYVKLHCSGRFKAFLTQGARPNGSAGEATA